MVREARQGALHVVANEYAAHMKKYLSALEREQAAWQALDGRLPGMPGCSPQQWDEWVDAVTRLNAEAQRCMRIHGLETLPGAGLPLRASRRDSPVPARPSLNRRH